MPLARQCDCAMVGPAGRHFASFAMASYGFILLKIFGLLEETYDMFAKGSHPIDVVLHQVGLDHDDLLLADLDGEHLGIPRHFVARDASTKSIVITVRGTSSLSDVIVDLLCESAPFGNGYAHSGIKDAAYSLYYAILPTVLSALEENEGYKVVTVGHSLGAGVAILLTKILLDNGFKGVKCYAISPPPVFGPMHAVDQAWSDALECFINEDDIVPRLSLQAARVLATEMEDINKVQTPAPRQELPTSSSGGLSSVIPQNSKPRQAKSHQIFSPLYIPTTRGVHWLLPHADAEEGDVDIRYRAVFASTSVFNRILVTPNCVTSHFPNRYMAAFNALPLPPAKGPNRSASDLDMPCSIYRYDGELGP
jgi:pimeloyl-ACP methyl ester carboxylesterase